jgi:hypothetical protein
MLYEPALAALGALPGARDGLLVVIEMAGPFGVPDIVALVGPQDRVVRRLETPVPPLIHEVDAAVTAVAMPNAARSAEYLARTLGWPIETVCRRIPHLARIGALLETAPKRYVRHPALQPLGRLYAVEAKVENWRRAVAQARTYNLWADSYVLALGDVSARVGRDAQDAVAEDGAGLLVNNRWVRRPRVRPRNPARRLWAAEHLVAAVLGAGYHPSTAP